MLVEDLGDAREFKSVAKAQALCDLADHPPIRPCHGGQPAGKLRWREICRSEFVTAPSFLPMPPPEAVCVRGAVVSGLRHANRIPRRDRSGERFTPRDSAFGRLTTGLLPMIPDRLNPAAMHRLKQVHGFEAGAAPQFAGAAQKSCTMRRCSAFFQFHVGGQRNGQPAHFAPPWRSAAGNGKRSGARPTDSPRQEVRVNVLFPYPFG